MSAIQRHAASSRQADTTCRGCGQVIYDHFLLMVSQEQWHIQCLKCVDCHARLEDELTCFIKEGHVFCRTDYYK